MSDLYTSLQVSPRKKRGPPSDGGTTTTPKKLRTTRPPTPQSNGPSAPKIQLPDHLTRLLRIQNAIQQALSHALATCAISPSSDSGQVLNVLNHISLKTYAGLTSSFGVEDLKRLCWIWEWDGNVLPEDGADSTARVEDDNPFLEASSPPSADWTRGSMGFTLSLGSHYSKTERKRIPVYGVGIEVELDIDKDMGGGMAAVARWTAAGEARRVDLIRKMEKWAKLHAKHSPVPPVPCADLPPLPTATKPSALTRTLASASPNNAATLQKFPIAPGSPSRSPAKKPRTEFALPFPVLPRSQSPTKLGRLLFPQTPTKRNSSREETLPPTPRTPARSRASSPTSSLTSTPVHQTGSDADTAPQTPTTSRRQALYERIRARSISKSPTKAGIGSDGTPMSRDQMLKFTQDEMRRRCLLERLPGIAESVWMLFSSSGSTSTPVRKRKTMPVTDIVSVIIKSSPVPISSAEANESLTMLMKLCPFFLKRVAVGSKEWLEMPSCKGDAVSSPQKVDSMGPRAVRQTQGGLREVREIIRREIEIQD